MYITRLFLLIMLLMELGSMEFLERSETGPERNWLDLTHR